MFKKLLAVLVLSVVMVGGAVAATQCILNPFENPGCGISATKPHNNENMFGLTLDS